MKGADLNRRMWGLLALVAVLAWLCPVARADLIDEDDDQPPDVTLPRPPAPTPAPTKLPGPKPKPVPAAEPSKPDKPHAPAGVSHAPAAGHAGGSVLAPKGNRAGAKGPAADDSKQPVHFESKGLRALKEKGIAELQEDVIVTQGTLRLEADKAKIFYDDEIKDVVRVIAEGNVKIFKVDEESGEKIKAYGDRAEFDNTARTVVLEGNARLWRGVDLVRGRKITYELDTGWIKADRVAGEVHPAEDKKP